MNVAEQEQALFPSAKEVDLRAAEWLERRHREEWSKDDQAELDAWFATSPAHRLAYLRVEAAWNRAHRLSALRRPQRDTKLLVIASRLPRFTKIAAAIAILSAAGTGFIVYVKKPPEQVYATVVGGHKIIALGDGSKVELNTDSVLRLEADANQRTMWLEKGEAYFQIRHDNARPFVVIAGDHRVTDLGTKFFVRTDPQHLEVSLIEGRIRFDAPDGRMREPLLLSPGDSVTTEENSIVVTHNSPRELAKELGWRRGVLVFDNATLANAAAEFNRYNREKIVIADSAVAQLRIDGTFPAENLEVFARAAQQLFELRVENRGGNKVISR
jgi:transmembrane sensor